MSHNSLDNPETLEADLAAISAYSNVKDHIRTYVNAGYTAMIPQRGVTVGSWSGQGWIVMDEETGAAGYMICGGLHNENTLINGGSLSEPLNNLILQIGLLLAKTLKTLDALVVATTIIGAGIAHIVAAIYVLAAYPTIFLFIPYVGGLVIGMLFIVAAIKIFEQLLKNIYTIHFRRRRQYAYA